MEFVAGQALANKEQWNADIALVEAEGVHVPQFLKKAISKSEVCYFDTFYFNKYQKPIRFNKRHFETLDHLKQTYKDKPEDRLNYNGTRDHAEEFKKLMDKYIDLGILK